MNNPFQEVTSKAAKKLFEAFENYKATKKAKKELEKILEQKLSENPEYLRVIEEEKNLKKQRRDMSERLADLKHQKELMTRELDEYEDLEQFVEQTEGDYLTRKDEVLGSLSRELSEQGITAELNFKSGDLYIVVSRKQ